VDFRGLLHRDGSVIAAVSIEEFASPDKLYRKLGCKLAVGMPFKVLLTCCDSTSVFQTVYGCAVRQCVLTLLLQYCTQSILTLL
jgi:hypothetical protein